MTLSSMLALLNSCINSFLEKDYIAIALLSFYDIFFCDNLLNLH